MTTSLDGPTAPRSSIPDAAASGHGGDLAAMRDAYPRARQPWIDLSTGINPWPYPVGRVPRAAWTRLPGRDEEAALRAAAAVHFGVRDPDRVVIGPGSQALIQWLPRLRPRGRVAVVTPTYSEHAASWQAAGHSVTTIQPDARVPTATDVLVVVRPNNPDGSLVSQGWLEAASAALARRGGLLVVDEAFADLDPAPSVFRRLHADSTVVLRSFGKFFGLAGGRLGFALASGETRKRLREALGPWPAPGPTMEVATRAYRDRAWIEGTRARLERGAARLDALAAGAGLTLVGGTSLFRLYRAANAQDIWASLAKAGLYVRRFADRPEWLRLGLLPDAAAARRLAEVLGRAR